jgi:hypothetical protein
VETLEMPEPKRKREEAKGNSAAVPQAVERHPPNDANPTHREDFNSLVGAAARKRERED